MRLHTRRPAKCYTWRRYCGYADERVKQKYRTNIQMIFQDPYASLDPRMNVLQLIEEPIKVNHKDMSKADVTARAKEMMELVGLAKTSGGLLSA